MRSMFDSLKKRGKSFIDRAPSKKGKGERNPKNQLLSTDITSQNQFGRKTWMSS